MSCQAMKRHEATLNAHDRAKKADLKWCTVRDSNSVTFWKRQNCGDSEWSVVGAGEEEG